MMNVESELNIPQEDWYETFIRYGLYFGAVFQLLCLCACVMLPGSKKVRKCTLIVIHGFVIHVKVFVSGRQR